MPALLELKGVEARYGPVKALHGVDITVEEGEIVAFHELEAAAEVGLDPTVDVVQSWGKHASTITCSLVHRPRVSIAEALHHQEQHDQDGTGLIPRAARS